MKGEVWGRERGGVTAFNPNGGQPFYIGGFVDTKYQGTINVFRLLRFFPKSKSQRVVTLHVHTHTHTSMCRFVRMYVCIVRVYMYDEN